MFQVAPSRNPNGLLVEKGIFTKEDFLERVKVVNGEMKR
jgi:hypothetical protein